MEDRKNTIAGWVLGAGIVGLMGWLVSGEVYKTHEPEQAGWQLAGGDEGESGGEAAQPVEFYLAQADAAKGADVFKKCTACHTINSGGANGLGPNLWGVLGKAHGVHPGFAFSDALKAVPGNWDWKAMDAWLASPRKYAPGTKMTFAGLGNPQDRANLMAYLNSNGSNLPIPAAPAAAAPAEGEAGNAVEAATGNEAAPAPATEAPPANAVAPAAAH